jgi:ribosomal protein S18 acetylase RimI-like enzyme
MKAASVRDATIRRAVPADVPVLGELAVRIWRQYYPCILSHAQIEYMLPRMYSADVIASELVRGVIWSIAERDGQPIGFSSLEVEAGMGRAKLHKLYLLPEFHGKGIGKGMLEHVKAVAAAGGAKEVYLQVNKRNQRAIKAYQRSGFRISKEIVVDIGDGFVMDDYIMRTDVESTPAKENRRFTGL